MSFGRQNLIFSRRPDQGELTVEDIMQRAPAVFNQQRAERLTDRYTVLDSSSVIPILADYGYVPVQASQKRNKAGSPVLLEQKAHLISFAHRNDLVEGKESRQEIILFNSHDGTSAVKLFAGNFRFICSNGIVSGTGTKQSVYHSAKALSGFEDALKNIIDTLPMIEDRLNRAKGIQLDAQQRITLAAAAAKARWCPFDEAPVDVEGRVKAGSYSNANTVNSILRVQRTEDDLQDAYTVWNRIQENVIRGNAFVQSVSSKGMNPNRKARAISSVAESIAVNQALFDLLPA